MEKTAKFKKAVQKWLANKLFKISDLPVLFRDLLEANALFSEGMLVDPAKLNYKFRLSNAYLLYIALCAVILLVLLLVTHGLLAKIDSHISIVSACVVTALVCVGFDFCKLAARRCITKTLIKRAWSVHFPHFAYEKYSKLLAQIYKDAIRKEVPKQRLESYILEQIVAQSGVQK